MRTESVFAVPHSLAFPNECSRLDGTGGAIVTTSGQSKRINEILYVYWESLRKGRLFPSEAEIEPDAIAAIWDSCFLVKVSRPEAAHLGYRYDYLGSALIEAFGGDVTHQEISSRLIDPSSPPLVSRFENVVNMHAPDTDEAAFTNKRGLVVKYRSCILPLGRDSGSVDYILGGMKWKMG
jgi:hypothetical protein